MFKISDAFGKVNEREEKLPEGAYDATVVAAAAYEDDPEKVPVLRLRLNVDVGESTRYITHWLRVGETSRALKFFFNQLEALGIDKQWIKNHPDAGLTMIAQYITDQCPDVILGAEKYEWKGEVRTQYYLNKR